VKTVKRLFTKCKEDGVSEFLALLDWRNTPSEGMGTSPAQRLMGRRCKTLLPMAAPLLEPRHSTVNDSRALLAAKAKQEHYYNAHSRPLPDLTTGASVRIRLPGEKTWTPGTCERNAAPKSYDIRVGPTTYRRNRRHIRRISSPQDPQLNKDLGNDDELERRAKEPDVPAHAEEPDVPAVPDELPATDTTTVTNEPPAHRSSKRLRTPNVRLRDYVC